MKFQNKIVVGGLIPFLLISAVLFFILDNSFKKISERMKEEEISRISRNVNFEVDRYFGILEAPLKETFSQLIVKLYSWDEINSFFIKFATLYPHIERLALFKKGKKIVEISQFPQGVFGKTPVNRNTSLSNIFWYNRKPFVNFEIHSPQFTVSGTLELAALFEKVNSFSFSPSGKIKILSTPPIHSGKNKKFLVFPILKGKWSFELKDDFSAFSYYRKMFRLFFFFLMAPAFLISFAILKSISDGFLKRLASFSSVGKDEISAVAEKIEILKKENRELKNRVSEQESVGILGRNVSVIGHELRNPISAIKNALYFISTQISEDMKKSAVGKHLRIMKNEVKMISHMIEDILTLSRIKPPIFTNCDVNEILLEIISVFGKDETLIDFHFEKGEIPKIKADVAEIKQVFSNLVKNSVEAITPPGEIFVKTFSSGNFVKITIKDTGCGIPASKIRDIFKPFFSTKSAGMGFGLATVRKIVEERHFGKIEVVSEEGRGTEFTISLPITRENG